MIQEELQPKTELERAFVQARSWEPMHSWRRGTTDLRSGRIGSAVGIYLALVRSQALKGHIGESEATLTSVDQYREGLSAPDKLSAIRVLCSIISEVNEEAQASEAKQHLQKCLTQSAVAFTAQIKEDKLAVMDALALIKKASEYDVIEDRLNQKQLEDLNESIEKFKESKAKLESESKPERADLPPTLDDLLRLANSLADQKQVLLVLSYLGSYLLDNRQTEAAKLVCENVLRINSEVARLSSPKTDIEIANALCAFGDKFFIKDNQEQACECFSAAIFARIRAKVFTDRSLEDIATIATQAVMSKQYDSCMKKLSDMITFLEIQQDASANFELLHAHAKIHHHLISVLAQPDAKLDMRSLSGLRELVDQSTKFSGSPFFVNILPHIAELLKSRVDKEYLNGILDLLWNSAYDFSAQKTYNTYILPLALITEQMLGSSTPRAYQIYTKIFEHMRKSKMDQKSLILFWRILTKMREESDGRSSPSLLPLLASQSRESFEASEFRDCLDIAERVQYMDISDLSGVNAGVCTIPHYVAALLELTAIHAQLPKVYGDPLALIEEIEKIAKANQTHAIVNSEIRAVVLEFVASISGSDKPKSLLRIPPLLDQALNSKELQ